MAPCRPRHLPQRPVAAILDYWPVLPIGIDMLVRDRIVLRLPYTVVGLALMVLLGLVAPSAGQGGLVEEHFDQPIGSARRAEVRLEHVSDRGDLGVWRTPGFEDAALSIRVHIRDAGSGSIVR